MTDPPPFLKVDQEFINWPRHKRAVMAVEEVCFDHPWSAETFHKMLHCPGGVGILARDGDGRVVGFMIWCVTKGHAELANIAVLPSCRRQYVASQMLSRLVDPRRLRRVRAMVRETNLAAQLMLKQAGFECVRIAHDAYSDIGEDGYVFVWRAEKEQDAPVPTEGGNATGRAS